jgi:hypothetical protein
VSTVSLTETPEINLMVNKFQDKAVDWLPVSQKASMLYAIKIIANKGKYLKNFMKNAFFPVYACDYSRKV